MSSRLRRRAPILVTALVAVAIAVPATAFGIHQFTDVPNTNPYHADIDALANSGVTTGCGNSQYCPSAFVTREQMAAFMNRLGALGPGKTPVVNASTALDSGLLDGLDSTAFLQAGPIVDGYGPTAWKLTSNYEETVRVEYDFGQLTVQRTAAGPGRLIIDPRVPASQHGVAYRLESVRYCASGLSASSRILFTAAYGYTTSAPLDQVFGTGDINVRESDGCFTKTYSSSDVADVITFVLETDFTVADSLSLHGITFTWAPVLVQ